MSYKSILPSPFLINSYEDQLPTHSFVCAWELIELPSSLSYLVGCIHQARCDTKVAFTRALMCATFVCQKALRERSAWHCCSVVHAHLCAMRSVHTHLRVVQLLVERSCNCVFAPLNSNKACHLAVNKGRRMLIQENPKAVVKRMAEKKIR